MPALYQATTESLPLRITPHRAERIPTGYSTVIVAIPLHSQSLPYLFCLLKRSLHPWTSNTEFVAVQLEKRRKFPPWHLCEFLGEHDAIFLQVRIHLIDVVALEDNRRFV